MAAEPIRIEQWTSAAICHKLAPNGSERLAIGRKLAGERLVFVEAVRDELRQPHSVEQTASEASRERIASTREQRQACPERVAAGRARVVGQCVEEYVGQGMAGEIVLVRKLFHEDEAGPGGGPPRRLPHPRRPPHPPPPP